MRWLFGVFYGQCLYLYVCVHVMHVTMRRCGWSPCFLTGCASGSWQFLNFYEKYNSSLTCPHFLNNCLKQTWQPGKCTTFYLWWVIVRLKTLLLGRARSALPLHFPFYVIKHHLQNLPHLCWCLMVHCVFFCFCLFVFFKSWIMVLYISVKHNLGIYQNQFILRLYLKVRVV